MIKNPKRNFSIFYKIVSEFLDILFCNLITYYFDIPKVIFHLFQLFETNKINV